MGGLRAPRWPKFEDVTISGRQFEAVRARTRPGASPAPWRLVNKEGECPYIVDAEGHDIAEFWSSSETITYQSRGNQVANAALCAKAPALFEAGRDLVRTLDAWLFYYGPPTDEVQAAIDRLRAALGGLE